MTALEQSLRDLCAKHDLTVISFSLDIRFRWSAYAHWNGGGSCASGHGDSIGKAIGAAILEANLKRGAVVEVALPDEAIEVAL